MARLMVAKPSLTPAHAVGFLVGVATALVLAPLLSGGGYLQTTPVREGGAIAALS